MDKEAAAHKIRFVTKDTEAVPGEIEQIQRDRPTLYTTDQSNKIVQDFEMDNRNEEIRQVTGYKGLQSAREQCLSFLGPGWSKEIHDSVLVTYGDKKMPFEAIAKYVSPFKTAQQCYDHYCELKQKDRQIPVEWKPKETTATPTAIPTTTAEANREFWNKEKLSLLLKARATTRLTIPAIAKQYFPERPVDSVSYIFQREMTRARGFWREHKGGELPKLTKDVTPAQWEEVIKLMYGEEDA